MPSPDYLSPYVSAAARHGGAFASLLWASPTTQAIRFHAITRMFDIDGAVMLDAGCGRADLYTYLLARDTWPARYIGLEGVTELADAADATVAPPSQIIRGDFVQDPSLLSVEAEVIVFCGSLNTMSRATFHSTLTAAYRAARRAVVFNFLASPMLARQDYLTWHRPAQVLKFARSLTTKTRCLDDYLDGDCTIALYKDATAP